MEQHNSEVLAVLDVSNRIFNLKSGNYTIGRDSDAYKHDIPIDNASIDIKHAALEIRLYGAKIIDLFSKNGTFIDGEDIGKLIFVDIYKSVPVRFGQVNGQFRLTAEGDSGFLGHNSLRDVSDIIPQSPEESNAEKRNSQILGRSRHRIPSQKLFLSSNEPSTSTSQQRLNISNVIVPSTQNATTNNVDESWMADVTDENIRRNIEKMEEEDDFYVPETQEIFGKRTESIDPNSQTMIRLSTQEFIDVDEKSNNSDNLLSNFAHLDSSQVIPFVRYSPVVVNEIKEEDNENEEEIKNEVVVGNSNNEEEKRPSVNDFNRANNDDDEETDAEEEMSILNWSESRTLNSTNNKFLQIKSRSVTPDLDLNTVPQEENARESSVTPDLDFSEQKSGSVTPDLEFGENVGIVTNTSEPKESYSVYSPTQVFIPKGLAASTENTTTIQGKADSLNVSPSNKENSEPNLDETQMFVFNKSRTNLVNTSKENLDDSVFLKPNFLNKSVNSINIAGDVIDDDDDDDLEPTQPFLRRPELQTLLSDNQNDSNHDLLSLETTQPFHFIRPAETNRKEAESSSPSILDSDEDENNSEFCFRDTFVVGEENNTTVNELFKENKSDNKVEKEQKKSSRKNSRSRSKKTDNSKSKSKSNAQESSPQMFRDDSLFFDIQQTPDVDFLKLPNTNEIREAGELFNRMLKGKKRNKILLEESSNDDESSSDEEEVINTDLTDNKNEQPEKVSTSKAKKKYSDEQMKNIRKQPVVRLKKNGTSMQVEEYIVDNQKGKSDTEKDPEKDTSLPQLKDSLTELKVVVPSTSSTEQTIEPEISAKRLRNTKITELKKDQVPEAAKNKKRFEDSKSKDSEKAQIHHKIMGKPQDGAKLRMKSKNSERYETKSVCGDNPTYTVLGLGRRTSSRIKSVPAHIVEDYFTEKDFQKYQTDDSKPSTRSRRGVTSVSSKKSSVTDEVSPKTSTKRNEKHKSSESESELKKRSSREKVKDISSTEIHENECSKITKKTSRVIRKTSKAVEAKTVNDDDYPIRTTIRRKVNRLISTDSESSSKPETQDSGRSTRRNKTRGMNKEPENSRKRRADASVDASDPIKQAKSTRSAARERNPSSASVENLRKSARQAKHRIAFTRMDSTPYNSAIKKIGAEITDSPQECTILIAEKVIRTWKFLAAMARGIPIVSPKWFDNLDKNFDDDSSSYDDYLIKDTASERHYKFSLKKSLYLARRKPIFRNFEFILTPNTKPTPTEMIQIIECGGGKVLEKLPKHLPDHNQFYIVSDKEDIAYWNKFRRALPEVQIVSTEAIMLAVIQQCINFKSFLLS